MKRIALVVFVAGWTVAASSDAACDQLWTDGACTDACNQASHNYFGTRRRAGSAAASPYSVSLADANGNPLVNNDAINGGDTIHVNISGGFFQAFVVAAVCDQEEHCGTFTPSNMWKELDDIGATDYPPVTGKCATNDGTSNVSELVLEWTAPYATSADVYFWSVVQSNTIFTMYGGVPDTSENTRWTNNGQGMKLSITYTTEPPTTTGAPTTPAASATQASGDGGTQASGDGDDTATTAAPGNGDVSSTAAASDSEVSEATGSGRSLLLLAVLFLSGPGGSN